jgi:hypothetical protein
MSTTAFDPWDLDTSSSIRAPRTLETRASSERERNYQPSTILPDPEPQAGWVFRWCRVAIHSQPDHGSYQRRLREGWEAVRAEDHPELVTGGGFGDPRYNGLIEIGGLILCKQPVEVSERRRQYNADFTRQKTEDADNAFLRDNNEKAMLKVAEKRRKTFTPR